MQGYLEYVTGEAEPLACTIHHALLPLLPSVFFRDYTNGSMACKRWIERRSFMLVAFPVSLIFIFSFLLFFFDAVAANFMPHYALVFFPSPGRENTRRKESICVSSGLDGLQSNQIPFLITEVIDFWNTNRKIIFWKKILL